MMIEDRKTLSFMLALAMHGLIAAALFFGLQWQTRPVPVEEIEFWSPPPPDEQEPPAPKPKPVPVAPEVEEPVPRPMPKPEIAVEVPKPKPPKPKVEPVPEPPKPVKPPPKPAPPEPEKPKPTETRSPLAELIARQKAAETSQRATATLNQLAQRNQASEPQAGSRTSSGAKDGYLAQIRNKIRRNMTYPDDASGNPETIVEVTLLPDMTVLEVAVLQSSGAPAFDEAVKRAILRTGQYPALPPELAFSDFRKHKLRYRLRD